MAEPRRLNNLTKQMYKISIWRSGAWCGSCPKCGRVFVATDVSTSQLGLVKAIEQHMSMDHPLHDQTVMSSESSQ